MIKDSKYFPAGSSDRDRTDSDYTGDWRVWACQECYGKGVLGRYQDPCPLCGGQGKVNAISISKATDFPKPFPENNEVKKKLLQARRRCSSCGGSGYDKRTAKPCRRCG